MELIQVGVDVSVSRKKNQWLPGLVTQIQVAGRVVVTQIQVLASGQLWPVASG